MNGAKKFHKPTGPAFKAGEVWFGISTKHPVEIEKVEKFGDGKWDFNIVYSDEDENIWERDAWNFQVRYQHQADLNI